MSDQKDHIEEIFYLQQRMQLVQSALGQLVWPLIDQMNPDSSVKALASTEVDVSSLEAGKTITVLMERKAQFSLEEEQKKKLQKQEQCNLKDLKHPEKDEDRAKNPEWLVMVGSLHSSWLCCL